MLSSRSILLTNIQSCSISPCAISSLRCMSVILSSSHNFAPQLRRAWEFVIGIVLVKQAMSLTCHMLSDLWLIMKLAGWPGSGLKRANGKWDITVSGRLHAKLSLTYKTTIMSKACRVRDSTPNLHLSAYLVSILNALQKLADSPKQTQTLWFRLPISLRFKDKTKYLCAMFSLCKSALQ